MAFVSIVTYVGFSQAASAVDTGPDGTYTLAPQSPASLYPAPDIQYTVANTGDVDAPVVTIPVYLKVGTPYNARIDALFFAGGSNSSTIDFTAGKIPNPAPPPSQINSYPATQGSIIMDIPTAGWTYDSGSGYYIAYITGNYHGSDRIIFKINPSGSGSITVGYSSSHNNAKFAIESTHRCSPTDSSACNNSASYSAANDKTWGAYYDYSLPFAPVCGVPVSATSQIQIYDPDNPGLNHNPQGIQPYAFSVSILDTTPGFGTTMVQSTNGVIDDTHYLLNVTDAGGNPATETDNKSTATITFKTYANHKYKLLVNNVYTNNVLQFRLPYDSIYAGLPCPAVSNFKNTPSIGTSDGPIQAGKTTSVTYYGSIATSGSSTGNYTARFGHPPNSGADSNLGSYATTAGTRNFVNTGASPCDHAHACYDEMTVNITPPAGTPSGTQYCATLSVTPHSFTDDAAAIDTVCITVSNVTVPQLIGNGGDVHAGGGLCGSTQYSGTVDTNDQSYGQYVVSTNATINGFGSNNNPGLKSASLGSYGQICRPDLASATAVANFASSGGLVYTRAGSTMRVADLNSYPGNNYLIKVNGPFTLTGAGTIQKTVTLLVNGDLTIPNTVLADTTLARSATTQPQLGIVAGGSITIGFGAAQVDALLFSRGGLINTCGGTGLQCQNTLVVNGFLMAHTIAFNRLGLPVVAAGQSVLAETVTLKPALYFDPPPLFAGGGSESMLLDLGERPPLY